MVKRIVTMLFAAMPMLAALGYTITTSSRLYYFESEGESDYRNGYRSLSSDKWFEWSSISTPFFSEEGHRYSWGANILADHMVVKDWGLIQKSNASSYPYFDFDKVEWMGVSSMDYTHEYDSSRKDSYLTLWLRWYRFNLSFNSNGGSEVDAISDIPYKVSTGIKENGYLTYTENTVSLPTPTRTGYTFNGWQRSGKTAFLKGNVTSSDIGVNADGENITLTAQWTANRYTVTFNANGGTVSSSGLTVTYNSTYGTLPTPTRAGYQFNGWYTAEDGGSQVKADTEVAITANQKLYAHWTEMYTVSFKSEGGTVYATYSVLYGEKVTPPSVEVPVGRRLDGWKYGGRLYAPTEPITVAYSMELIAQFEMLHTEVHSLSCEPVDGGSVGLSPVVGGMYGDYGREVILTATPSVSHNFVRWSDGSTDPNHKVRIVCDTNFVAHFEKKYFTVNFFDMDGTTPLTAAQRIEYGNPAVAPSAPQHVGLTFTGWEPSDFGSVVSNMSIVAQYETNSYTVVYDPNGGTGSMTNDVFMYFMEYGLQSNSFVRPVHEFVGWASNPCATTNEVEYADGDIVSNLTAVAGGTNVLYAVWHSLVSEYSIAADCTNLVLECANEKRKWAIDLDHGFASTSSVMAAGYSVCDMTALIEGTGTLTFRLKILTASTDNSEFNLHIGDILSAAIPEIKAVYYYKELNDDWLLCSFRKTDPLLQKFIWNYSGKSDEDRVYVDQVRWYPNRLVSVDTSGESWVESGHEANGIAESLLTRWDDIFPDGITEVHIDATKPTGAESLNSPVTNALSILNFGYKPEYTVNGSTANLTFTDAPVLAINAFEVEDSVAASLGASVTNTSWGLPDYSNGVDKALAVWGAPTLTSDWSRVDAECDLSRYVSEGIALFDFDVGTNRFFKVKAE